MARCASTAAVLHRRPFRAPAEEPHRARARRPRRQAASPLELQTDFASSPMRRGRIASPAIEAVLAFDPRASSAKKRCCAPWRWRRRARQGCRWRALRGLAGLEPEDVRLLALFDVLTPEDGRYGFNLKIAQHVAGLRRRGVSLAIILTAATVSAAAGAAAARTRSPGSMSAPRAI